MSFKVIVVVGSLLAATGIALASPSPGLEGEEACQRITAACEAAGYSKDGKDKNLSRDCVKPILAGKAVTGVKVDGGDVKACKENRAPKQNTAHGLPMDSP